MIGSLSLGQLLQFSEERVLKALSQGMPVYLYQPGLPESPGSRGLSAAVSAACRELKAWGIRFVDGKQKHLITALQAETMRLQGIGPEPGEILTPLAREILEGST